MKRVLVTGASGFIGRHALPILINRGFEVHALSQNPPEETLEGIVWHQGDLFAGKLDSLFHQIEPGYVLHLAWDTQPQNYQQSAKNREWIKASADLMQALANAEGTRIVTAGSCLEYGHQSLPCSEMYSQPLPNTPYGQAKLETQSLYDMASTRLGIRSAWARLFYLFGPHEHPDRLIPSLIKSLLSNKPFPCTEGTQVRDYLYVDDVADALVTLLDSPITGPINIASGHPQPLKDLLLAFGEAIGHPELIHLGEKSMRADEAPSITADITRQTYELEWQPKTPQEVAIENTIHWWKSVLS